MFALGFLSNLTKAAGPTKDEAKNETLRQQQISEDRDANAKATDDKRKQRDSEDDEGNPSKENKDLNKPAGGEEEEMMTKDEFVALEKRRGRYLAELEKNEDMVDGHKNYVPRRWMVRIWNLHLESLVKDECMCFLNINWGGDRKECRVKTGEGEAWWDLMSDTEVVWGIGTDPLCLRTNVMELLEKGTLVFSNEFSFEWRGSYSDLQTQNMEIELWRFNRIRANTLDSVHKSTLDTYASGPVFQEAELTKSLKQDEEQLAILDTQKPTRFKVTFQLYFQELFDFELNVVDVQAFDLMSVDELARAVPRDFVRRGSGKSTDIVAASILDPSGDEESEEEKVPEGKASLRRRGAVGSMVALSRTHSAPLRRASRKLEAVKKLKRKVILSISNPTFKERLRRGEMEVRSDLKKTDNLSADRWGNVGKIYYRGTLADLDNDLLYLRFFESNLLAPSVVIAEAAVSLRGVHEYGNISGGCCPPQWALAKDRASASAGRFEAKLTVENLPKYKQSGELCDMIADKAYLLVKVLRVDRVAIPDQRPISQCDSAVQVQFSGTSYETDVRQDTIAPQFDQEFYFELKTNKPAECTPAELAQMHGPIIFDVWLRSDDEGALSAEHCGHVEIGLEEIFTDGKPEQKLHNSIRTGELTEYRTQVLKARKRVVCLWTVRNGASNPNVPASALAPSHLFVDIWLRPFDFAAFNMHVDAGPKPAKAGMSRAGTMAAGGGSETLPAAVRDEWSAQQHEWDARARDLTTQFPGLQSRNFEYVAKSQNRDEYFLPLFLDVIRPPEVLGNPNAIAFWMHCLSHTSMDDLKAAERFLSTPDFTLSLGKGDTFAHAVLHVSMLRGLGAVRPLVCVGTGWDGAPIAWVTLLRPDGSVAVYDTASHRCFELPNRCADVDRARRVAVGKRPAAQQVSPEMQQLEMRRRDRLRKQEVSLRSMTPEPMGCDPGIFRAPELLKLFDPTIHEHALVYSTTIQPHGRCYRCGLPPQKRELCGFVCNQKLVLADYSSTEAAVCLADDSGAFLCVRCAAKCYDEPAKMKVDHFLQPMKFQTQPTLPYKTIDVIFDETNCWMNMQHFCPCAIYYDLWNPLYWHPFTTVATTFRSFSVAAKGLRKAKSKEYLDAIKARIVAKVKRAISALRRNGNLGTFFQRELRLIEHMELGLELHFRLELVPDSQYSSDKLSLETELTEWKLQLYSKIPRKHRFVGYTFQFSFYDSIEIARIITEQINFNALKENGTQFVVSAYLGKLPNSVTACYVSVGVVYPLVSESVIRGIIDTRESASPFADEIVEQTRLFALRSSIFETDLEFIAAMRTDLYKDKEKSGVVVGTYGSKAPVSAKEFVKSIVDYSSEGKLHELQSADLPDSRPSEDEEQAQSLGQPLMDQGLAMMDSIAAMGNQGFGYFQDKLLAPEPPMVALKRSSVVKPPKDFSQKHHISTPLTRVNALNPTPEELQRIYQPERFDTVTGQRQLLKNSVTGKLIPIPPQTPLLHAVSLGADHLVSKIHVTNAASKRLVTKVNPTKEAFIKFNSRINEVMKN